MQQIAIPFAYLAISQLLLLGAFYLVYFRRESLALLVAAHCVCLIAYILVSLFEFGPGFTPTEFVLGRFAVASPAVLWMIVHMLFVDDKPVSAIVWIVMVLYQLVRAFVSLVGEMAVDSLVIMTLSQLGYMAMIALAAHVVVMALREHSHDLLQERRKMRVPLAAGMGLVVALIVGAILTSRFMEASEGAEFLQFVTLASYVSIFILSLIFNLQTYRVSTDTQLIVKRSPPETRSEPKQGKILSEKDQEIMRELNSRMQQERFYTDCNLTISRLAKKLSVQEYKLRIIINKGLGYRNFNQFLNHYRISEACALLEEDAKKRKISAIAHDVGFTSLSSFNLAFKTRKGITPSAFKESRSNCS